MSDQDDDKAMNKDLFNLGIIPYFFYLRKTRREFLLTKASMQEREDFVQKHLNMLAIIFVGLGCLLLLPRYFR